MKRLPVGGPSFFTGMRPYIVERHEIKLTHLMDVLQANKTMIELFLSDSSLTPRLDEPIGLFFVHPTAKEEGRLIAVIDPKEEPLPIYQSYSFDTSRVKRISDLEELKTIPVEFYEQTRLYAAAHRSGSRFWLFNVFKVGPLTLESMHHDKPLFHVFPTVLHWATEMK